MKLKLFDLIGALLRKAVSNTPLPLQLTLNLLGRFFPGKYFFSMIPTKSYLLSLKLKHAFLASELATFGSFVRVVRDAGCVVRMLTKKTRRVRGKTSPPNVSIALEIISPRRQIVLSLLNRKKYRRSQPPKISLLRMLGIGYRLRTLDLPLDPVLT